MQAKAFGYNVITEAESRQIEQNAEAETKKFEKRCFKWEIMYMYEDVACRKLKNPLVHAPEVKKVPSVKDIHVEEL